MLYPACVGKEKTKQIKQIINYQLARLPEISSLTNSSLGEYCKDKETADQPIPACFFTVFASNSNFTRLNPCPYFFITSTPTSVFYRLDKEQTLQLLLDITHCDFTKSHHYSASLILRLHTWALSYLQALVEPTSNSKSCVRPLSSQ